jgi:hypothetical protein
MSWIRRAEPGANSQDQDADAEHEDRRDGRIQPGGQQGRQRCVRAVGRSAHPGGEPRGQTS